MKRAAAPKSPKPDISCAHTGKIAIALCGRDAGRSFLITGGGETPKFVYIADGRTRRYSMPKKKSLRHLSVIERCDEAAKLIRSGALSDKRIRRILYGFKANMTADDIGIPSFK